MSSAVTNVKSSVNNFFQGKEAWQVSLTTSMMMIGSYLAYQSYQLIKKDGLKKTVIKSLLNVVKAVPLAKQQVEKETNDTIKKMEKMVLAEGANETKQLSLPNKGIDRQELLSKLEKWSAIETSKWNQGQVSGGIYHGGDELVDFCTKVYRLFALGNPLHSDLFPYIRKMEAEVVQMTVKLFNGNDDCCGSMTSGGTESILMAMKTYRDRARDRGIQHPELVLPVSAHAAFDKACHYFDIKLVHIPVDPITYRADMNAMKKAINKNTMAIVGSAPCYAQGVVDPIEEMSELALKHNIGLHVDCCLGSFLIPMLPKLGYNIPKFDFSLPGVSSISADTHKFGYSPKGTSVVMYNSHELRRYQYFVAAEWCGGVYASPSLPGSRPGGLIAATWAALVSMGHEGYLDCARQIMNAAKIIEAGVRKIEGLRVLGQPDMSIICFDVDHSSAKGKKLSIFKIGEAMGKKHWNLNFLLNPSAIHICCTYMHRDRHQQFLADLQQAVEDVCNNPDAYKGGNAAIYGMAESIPDGALITDIAKGFLDCLFKV